MRKRDDSSVAGAVLALVLFFALLYWMVPDFRDLVDAALDRLRKFFRNVLDGLFDIGAGWGLGGGEGEPGVGAGGDAGGSGNQGTGTTAPGGGSSGAPWHPCNAHGGAEWALYNEGTEAAPVWKWARPGTYTGKGKLTGHYTCRDGWDTTKNNGAGGFTGNAAISDPCQAAGHGWAIEWMGGKRYKCGDGVIVTAS
jgi:hypothetical protein